MTHKKPYKFRIDRESLESQEAELTGRQLLARVGKTPDGYRLHQRLKGGRVEIVGPDDIADLSKPGVERFMTLPLDQTEGDGTDPRREFPLPAEDEEFLNAHRFCWETVTEGTKKWLLLHSFPVSSGYATDRATVAIFIPPGYPDAALDMVWFHPPLHRKDKRPIRQTNASESIGGKQYQRWSRHRTAQNPWRPAVDCISTHLGLVNHWLERALA